jgi:leucyl/phenylalanyl-tRNA--protein transferase
MAVLPPPTGIRFPDPRRGPIVVAVGEDYRAGTLLEAYRHGIFPWPHTFVDDRGREEHVVAWFSPDPRALFPLDREPHWSRSLRRTLRKKPWRITIDRAFEDVIHACGEEREEGTWITPRLIEGYVALYELGWAHSLEVWEGSRLIGGIYGVAIGRAFAAESMFHRETDASKVAFAHLAMRLRKSGYAIFDAQVQNPHLASLGVIEVPRTKYLDLLAECVKSEPESPIGTWT